MSLVDRNIIKFDLTSREMSLQPPGLFLDAFDVKYFDTSGGRPKDAAILRYPAQSKARKLRDETHGIISDRATLC